jgi:hypothetical protein
LKKDFAKNLPAECRYEAYNRSLLPHVQEMMTMITESSLPIQLSPIINSTSMPFISDDRCIIVKELFDADQMIWEALAEINAGITWRTTDQTCPSNM